MLLRELPATNRTHGEAACVNSTSMLIAAIEDPKNLGPLDMTAEQLFDSWGTSLGDPGKYRQCIADDNRYCELVMVAQDPIDGVVTYNSGVCFPPACSIPVLQGLTAQIVAIINGSSPPPAGALRSSAAVTFRGIVCNEVAEVWGSPGAMAVLGLVTLTAALVLTASMLDAYGCARGWGRARGGDARPLLAGSINGGEGGAADPELMPPRPPHALPSWRSTWRRVVVALSAHRSWATLTGAPSYCRQLRVLDGLKVISLCWVMAGQTLLIAGRELQNPIYAVRDIQEDPQFQLVLNASLATDTFLLISGFLSTHIVLHRFATRGHAPRGKGAFFLVSSIFVRRVLRMTPLLAIVMAIYTQLLPILIQGPFAAAWLEHPDYASCSTTWWTNLMYVNNLVPASVQFDEEQGTLGCMGWYWYATVDMQLFILGPIMAFGFWHHGSKAIWAVLLLLAMCIGVTAYVVVQYHVTACADNVLTWTDPMVLLLNKPWTRAAPHLLGSLLACFFNAMGEEAGLKGIPVPAAGVRSVLMALSTILMLTPIFGTYRMRAGTNDQNFFAGQCSWTITVNDLYLVLYRGCFSLGLFLLVLLCQVGWVPWVTSVLSLASFTPLSRLAFGAYLIHPLLVEILVYGGDRKLNFTSFSWLTLYAGFVLLSFCLSAAMFLLWESPLNVQRRAAIRV